MAILSRLKICRLYGLRVRLPPLAPFLFKRKEVDMGQAKRRGNYEERRKLALEKKEKENEEKIKRKEKEKEEEIEKIKNMSYEERQEYLQKKRKIQMTALELASYLSLFTK